MTETQRRFLREIAARVGESRIHEVRLFPAIRQGGIESGVAIVAARRPEPAPLPTLPEAGDVERAIPVTQELDAMPLTSAPDGSPRYEILAARYKLVLKGTERGQWAAEVRHEADAPLETIDRVVRGVALRAGEDGEPECIADAGFREALSDAPFLTGDDLTAENGTG
ncbi:MAG: hypothetical protein ACT4P6_16545 [Gemmatimonadaceae bacterium]